FRWIGLYWFFTFSKEDLGLLQGDMGVSMTDPRRPQRVNDLVGDRILFTILLSTGTILFTWSLAIPIGIYSAVKQYSPGDYMLTFLGFVGMSIPGFLLALLVMYWGGRFFDMDLTGLFSPEFKARPEWSWGKLLDLFKHVWVPILVLGIQGTASMIRIMRGNLLDELKKPYVVTARAKGVRPFKLVMKYPVRMALNPFISTIGSLFPELISGGAIVAVVLGLPTVGPLLLDSLLSEDIYLAGSMLIVLSFLGILGTLVSDLLLMWLDPRIRMEGR
ncbi:MAG: ABC transporter permease, partial [Verrucomicrobiae bacterium]|nr:ABC transporter permease [Verrucomicrobiae bacterium]